MALPFNHADPVVRGLASAISHNRAILQGGHTTVEGMQICRSNIAKYRQRLADMGVPA